jgi:hypothetical protein
MNTQRMTQPQASERRRGAKDRRTKAEDRRNADRVADDLVPRRDPERRGRRNSD